jgi:outer membrane protein assembly factor BamE (lipoprotein component of BamABCDE complex)
VAVYFDRNRKVERLADYGMKDGKIFDYVAQKTPSGGEELSYISYLFRIFKWG